MSGAMASINSGIKTLINGSWTTTPIAWENVAFDPESDAPKGYWIRPRFYVVSNTLLEKPNGLSQRDGFIRIDIFSPKNSGNNTPYAYGDTLEALFRHVTIDPCLNFQEPVTTYIGVSEGYNQHQMQCDFYRLKDN